MNEYILPITLVFYFNINLIMWIYGLLKNKNYIKEKPTYITLISTIAGMVVFLPYYIYIFLKADHK